MEAIYPYLSHNLVRPAMHPIVVPNEAYDRALDAEWSNPYGVSRVGDKEQEQPPAAVEAPRRGRPRKGA